MKNNQPSPISAIVWIPAREEYFESFLDMNPQFGTRLVAPFVAYPVRVSRDLLPSCYDDWIAPERERLRQQCRNACQRLVRVLEAQREYPTALQMAEQLLQLDPLDEETYQTLISLHSLIGNLLAVRRIYQ